MLKRCVNRDDFLFAVIFVKQEARLTKIVRMDMVYGWIRFDAVFRELCDAIERTYEANGIQVKF